MKALAVRFAEESSLELYYFLSNDLAQALENRLRDLDAKDGLGPDRPSPIPCHTAAMASPFNSSSWRLRGPPHKWRYCTLASRPANAIAVEPRAAQPSSDEILRSLQDELFPSDAFRAWLAIVASLVPLGWFCEARRFRPGLDYTLATSDDKEARLDVVLGLTPETRGSNGSANEKSNAMNVGNGEEGKQTGWQAAEWGGWEVSHVMPFVFEESTHSFFSVTWPHMTRKMILRYTDLGPPNSPTHLPHLRRLAIEALRPFPQPPRQLRRQDFQWTMKIPSFVFHFIAYLPISMQKCRILVQTMMTTTLTRS